MQHSNFKVSILNLNDVSLVVWEYRPENKSKPSAVQVQLGGSYMKLAIVIKTAALISRLQSCTKPKWDNIY